MASTTQTRRQSGSSANALGNVVTEQARPARPYGRVGRPDFSQPRPLAAAVDIAEPAAAADDEHFGAGVDHTRRDVGRRSAGAKDHHPLSREFRAVRDRTRVAEPLARNMNKRRRDLGERPDAGRQYGFGSVEPRSVLELELKAFALALDSFYVARIDLGNETPLERLPVGDIVIAPDRLVDVGVGEPVGLAKRLQGETARGLGEIGGETVRFQPHADGHAVAPEPHGAAEDQRLHASRVQMRRDRKSGWAGANHRRTHRHIDRLRLPNVNVSTSPQS